MREIGEHIGDEIAYRDKSRRADANSTCSSRSPSGTADPGLVDLSLVYQQTKFKLSSINFIHTNTRQAISQVSYSSISLSRMKHFVGSLANFCTAS